MNDTGPRLASRNRLLGEWGGLCGQSSHRGVGEGLVGVLEGETSNFAWGQSKIGSSGGDIGVGL